VKTEIKAWCLTVAERCLMSTPSFPFTIENFQARDPHPRVQQLACNRLGLASDAIGFVSSNYRDSTGVKKFGFWNCRVNRSEAIHDVLAYTPDAVTRNLTDLVDPIGA
jgi:FMN phosphatase YigB (HAD superfamily)